MRRVPASPINVNTIDLVCVYKIDSIRLAAKIAADYWQGTLHLIPEHDPMSVRKISPPVIDVSDSRFERPWNIDMESFFSFSFEMSERLLDLQSRHLNPFPADDELFEAAASSAQWM